MWPLFGQVLSISERQPRPENRPLGYCCYGHDDFQLATTEASYGAAEEGSSYSAHNGFPGSE